FYRPDEETFTCLGAMKRAIARGGTLPAAVNGANEVAVALFLKEKIGYLDIGEIACTVADTFTAEAINCVDDVLAADAAARAYVTEKYSR
ncbi:MAG: 1-deoxy-D-xylulose-5-phosphate reductoisomerase, partial [Clostridia bacterium]|nr:1-deoxy-D-xylulose-5-phosphate reductoisomerase [Clostridia bacterium]